ADRCVDHELPPPAGLPGRSWLSPCRRDRRHRNSLGARARLYRRRRVGEPATRHRPGPRSAPRSEPVPRVPTGPAARASLLPSAGGGSGPATTMTSSPDGALPSSVTNSASPSDAEARLPALRTENLAIVFTDIVGYTARTSRQTREENKRLLA